MKIVDGQPARRVQRAVVVFVLMAVCGASTARAQTTCDDAVREARREWGASRHLWLASVFHNERADISETWCRIFETQGADRIPKIEDFGRTLFTGDGIHPSVGSIVPGSGLSAGGVFNLSRALQSAPLRLSGSAEGRRSLSGFWEAGGFVDIAGSGDTDDNRHIHATVFARHQDLPGLRHYGIGKNTTLADETEYALDLTTAGGQINVPLPAAFVVSGLVEGLWAASAGPPALTLSTSHLAVGGGVGWRYPISERLRGYRTNATIGWRMFNAADDAPYSFHRIEAAWTEAWSPDTTRDWGEVTTIVRFTGSTTRGGGVVPFYLQPTLGGSDIDGTAALRSFRDYRFRAPNALAVQIEYEHGLGAWPIGLWGFVDAGQVAESRGDFVFGDFRRSYGAGVTVHVGGGPLIKLYVGWGGGEGSHTTFTGNSNSLGAEGSPRGVF